MAKLRHFILTDVSFIGGVLLAAGSRITSDDLGTYVDPADGKTKPVKPGETLVEVDETGAPVNDRDYDRLRTVLADVAGVPIAPVMPFAPNATKAQAAPAQPPGGVAIAENQLPLRPANGVESDEAAEARRQQADNAADTVEAMTNGPKSEAPQRRNAGGTAEFSPVDKTADFANAGRFTVASAEGIGMYSVNGPGLTEPQTIRGKDKVTARLDELNAGS